jgi:hypothetical protein
LSWGAGSTLEAGGIEGGTSGISALEPEGQPRTSAST